MGVHAIGDGGDREESGDEVIREHFRRRERKLIISFEVLGSVTVRRGLEGDVQKKNAGVRRKGLYTLRLSRHA